ncbi:HAD family hydrolase [Candidatus Solirubrobacter pratensis]|uniref:HAD family hydrolase n=1 Tax=Candidatus Solirubrobacter pratensis TaxID=1298857 RepID=UPI0006885862|nr:HAD family hydrolase [Candidatus Solirubrobacter pratensis]
MADWVFFDLNGTLVDPGVLIEPRELALDALDHANVLAMITTLGGRDAPFRDLLEAALRRLLQRDGRDPGEAAEALERLPRMPAFPEAQAALRALRDAGFRLAVLTQSAVESAEAVLAGAGLELDRVLSASPFKPDPRAYEPARGGWFVAAHWWDVAGAAGAGLETAWVSRDDRVYPRVVPQPRISAPDLLSAAEAIVSAGPAAGGSPPG